MTVGEKIRHTVWRSVKQGENLSGIQKGSRKKETKKRIKVADIVFAQFGGSPVKVGEDEYHLFRDSE